MSGEFAYHVEQRSVTGDGTTFFVVEDERRFEMAPWFSHEVTAMEIAEKATRGAEFCDRIPCVPVGTTVPRPAELVFVPAPGKTAPPVRRVRR